METSREMRGRQIFEKEGQIERIDLTTYRVSSQSGPGFYRVIHADGGGPNWSCSCPDHTNRTAKCKHIWAVQFSLAIKAEVKAEREEITQIESVNISSCRFCGSAQIVRDGVRHNKAGNIQLYLCRDCGRYFSFNIGFEKMKASPQAITSAMQLYFTGESLRNVQKFLRLQGVNVSHVAVYKWITKYVRLMEKYLDRVKPKVGNTWRADELWVKFKGSPKYVFAMMDDETRFWIAQEVGGSKTTYDARNFFAKSKEVVGRKPVVLITDGLKAYHDAYKRMWWTHSLENRTHHIRHISMKGNRNNNKMERMNGEIRDREKVMRGLKTENTPILKGYQIYHNYLRPHESLQGRTPAEACGISVQGSNKWLTLIQNAKLQNEKLY